MKQLPCIDYSSISILMQLSIIDAIFMIDAAPENLYEKKGPERSSRSGPHVVLLPAYCAATGSPPASCSKSSGARSKRSRSITLVHAAEKSSINFSWESLDP